LIYRQKSFSPRRRKKKAEASKNVEEEIGLRLKEARAEAEKIIKQAEEQARTLVEIQRQKRMKSCKTLLSRVTKKERIRPRVKSGSLRGGNKGIEKLISQFEKARENMIDELEDDIISLIMETSKKVINIELEKDEKYLKFNKERSHHDKKRRKNRNQGQPGRIQQIFHGR
jgi:flagellar biosynthesis/type III secretory pathway protein FliH